MPETLTGDEADAVTRLLLECGRPVKDEDWLEGGEDWRDYDWDHFGNGCSGWSVTGQSEVVEVPLDGGVLVMLTHCRCDCRVYPHVTVGLEGYRKAG